MQSGRCGCPAQRPALPLASANACWARGPPRQYGIRGQVPGSLGCSGRPAERRRAAPVPGRRALACRADAASAAAAAGPRLPPPVRQPLELRRLIHSIPARKLVLWLSVALFLWPLHDFFGVRPHPARGRAAARGRAQGLAARSPQSHAAAACRAPRCGGALRTRVHSHACAPTHARRARAHTHTRTQRQKTSKQASKQASKAHASLPPRSPWAPSSSRS
jgi:hypothetical protein